MQNTADILHENEILKEILEEKECRMKQLEELVKLFRQRRFGPSSEKVSPEQLGFFNEAESLVDENVSEGDVDEESDESTI